MSIETKTTSKLVYPEDVHPLDITDDILGRTEVLAHDFHIGRALVLDQLKKAALGRSGNEPQEEALTTFYTPESLFTPEEQELADEWNSAVQAVQMDGEHEVNNFMPNLETVRKELSDISISEYGKILDSYFDTIAPRLVKSWLDSWVKAQKKQNPDFELTGRWLQWLRRPHEEPGDVIDQQLMNFLQWHNDRIEQLQYAPEVEDANRDVDVAYVGALRIAQGDWLTDGASERARAVLGNKSNMYRITDEFDAIFDDTEAYLSNDTVHYASMGSDAYDPRRLIKAIWQTGFHERNHKALGHFDERWLDEVMAEHVGEVLKGERVLDDLFTDDDDVYGVVRNILGEIIEWSRELAGDHLENALTVRDYTLAYSSPANSLERDTLETKERALFGVSIGEYVAERIRLEASRLEAAGVKSSGYARELVASKNVLDSIANEGISELIAA